MCEGRGPAPGRSVLVVCHANTARSVIAQVLLEKMLAERDADHGFCIRSGGIATYARDGMLPSLDARLALKEIGVHLAEDGMTSTDLKRHRHLIAEADLIVTMTARQKDMLAAYAEAAGRTMVTLREWAGESGDIEDPAGQGEEAFRYCRDEIVRCLEKAVPRLLEGMP
jgi:protein-tyrosine-phosphatase